MKLKDDIAIFNPYICVHERFNDEILEPIANTKYVCVFDNTTKQKKTKTKQCILQYTNLNILHYDTIKHEKKIQKKAIVNRKNRKTFMIAVQ